MLSVFFLSGDSLTEGSAWWISMDGQVILHLSSAERGVAALFASYFIFNVEYEPTVTLTLDFIQK